VLGGVIAGAFTLIVFAPFWAGLDTFKTFVGENNKVITSIPQLIAIKLAGNGSYADAEHFVRNLDHGLFAVCYLALLYGVYRRPSFNTLVAACALAAIAYLCLEKWWFRPWYFFWFLPLTALLPSLWWTLATVAATFGATFFDLIEQYRVHYPWLMADAFRAYAAPVVAAFLPLVLLLLLGLAVSGTWTMLRDHGGREGPA
jgi:hypothetical protein